MKRVAGESIAIIGMALRLPGATGPQQFWQRLLAGEGFLRPTVELRGERRFVTIDGTLPNWDGFDAPFFGFSAREALYTDPQHRLLLELAWEAFEDAAIDVRRDGQDTGLFVSTSHSRYLQDLLRDLERPGDYMAGLALDIGNSAEHAALRIAHRLNLHGPALSVATACSSSLVATALAVQALRAGDCRMALVAAASVRAATRFEAVDGGIYSPDGRCRPFDAGANGTVPGQGGVALLLKRLADARADGDPVYATIVATSVNNDGSRKVGYTAPSIDGQAQALRRLLAQLEGGAAGVGLVETHGTGTPIGDPIELAALRAAFADGTQRHGACALGAVKASVGHLDAAAGAVGLAKAALCLHHAKIAPQANYERPNPLLDLDHSPFFINTAPVAWPDAHATAAVVCSLGIGGTNAFVALERAPGAQAQDRPAVSAPAIVLCSGQSTAAADELEAGLAKTIEGLTDVDAHDVAHTTQTGRVHFACRRALIVDRGVIAERLRAADEAAGVSHRVVLMFAGQGQTTGAGVRELLALQPGVDATVRKCARYFSVEHGIDALAMLVDPPKAPSPPDTRGVQAGLFSLQYALAADWMERGIAPAMLVGHSVGEVIALCASGALSLVDAMDLVAARGQAMHRMPPGAMLAARIGVAQAREFVGPGVDIAAVNGPGAVVFSGATDRIETTAARLSASGIPVRVLPTSHAFHSALMGPAGDALANALRGVEWLPPRIPLSSTVRPGILGQGTLADPAYWRDSIVGPVHFHDAVERAAAGGPTLFIEVGPTPTLASIVRASAAAGQLPRGAAAVACMPDPMSFGPHDMCRVAAMAWIHGCEIDWTRLRPPAPLQRVRLPTYPFQRQRYMPGPASAADTPAVRPEAEVDVPRTTVEDIFASVLGTHVSDTSASFLSLGGDSLGCISVVRLLNTRLGAGVTMADFLADPSVAGVLRALRRGPGGGAEIGHQVPPLAADLVAPAHRPVVSDGDPGLVTGATGFVGSHLLAELLERTDRHFFCLARPSATDPVEAALRRYGLWKEGWNTRFTTVQGDICLPRLGLDSTQWRSLATEVGDIYHAAATVNHVYPVDRLWEANVGSVERLLLLACEGRPKVLHFLSTMAVFDSQEYAGEPVLADDWPLRGLPHPDAGYARSKALAEGLLHQAKEAGVALTVMRLPNVIGAAATGHCNHRDGLWALVKAIAVLGAVPPWLALNSAMHPALLAPADQIAVAIRVLAGDPAAWGRCLHVFPSTTVDLSEFVSSLRRTGHHLREVDDGEWASLVASRRRDPQADGYLWVLRENGGLNVPPARYYRPSDLRGKDRPAPPIVAPGPEALDRCIRRLVADGFLPPGGIAHSEVSS